MKGAWLVMVWVRSPVYFYKRGETFYFSRAVPRDLQHRFDKRKVEVSLRTKSEPRARKSAAALAEASCTDGGCWFGIHLTMCYYDIILVF